MRKWWHTSVGPLRVLCHIVRVLIPHFDHGGADLLGEGLSVRQVVVLLSTVYSYTLSFVMEEQAVFPLPNERSPRYDIAARNAKLNPKEFPILRQSGAILFDKFDRRYKEGLELILHGAAVLKDQT